MTEILCEGERPNSSEFQKGLTAPCGPTALSSAEGWAQQSYVPMLDVYHRMRAKGRCAPNGASQINTLAAQARDDGFRIDMLGFRNPMPESAWHSWFLAHVGAAAIVFEPSNGQALRDYLTGQGEDANNLKFHFATIFGWNSGGSSKLTSKQLPAGWWVADGDNNTMNPVVNGVRRRVLNARQLCYYPDAVVAASRPVAALAIYPKVAIPGGTGMAGVPSGWHDNGSVLTAPNGVQVVQGFRTYVLKAWEADNWPLAAEANVASVEPGNPAIGAGTRQDYRYRSLGWTKAKGVYRIWAGQDVRALEQQLAAAQATIKQLQESGTGDPKAEALLKAVQDAVK